MCVEKNQNTDIHLQAGDIYFGKAPANIKTLLGSCVSLTVWHAKLKVGGICHYLLVPTKEFKAQNLGAKVNDSYRYALPSLEYLYRNMLKHAPAEEYEICLFGGSNMYSHCVTPTIGEKNIAFAQQWLKQHKLTVKKSDILGDISRTILFNLTSGQITVKQYREM
jgi:chemotaxis protein CheD